MFEKKKLRIVINVSHLLTLFIITQRSRGVALVYERTLFYTFSTSPSKVIRIFSEMNT